MCPTGQIVNWFPPSTNTKIFRPMKRDEKNYFKKSSSVFRQIQSLLLSRGGEADVNKQLGVGMGALRVGHCGALLCLTVPTLRGARSET